MKLRAITLSMAALLASTVSVAGMVSVSSNIDILAIDGQKASKNLLKETRSFTVNDTDSHQVVVRVAELIGSSSNQSLFESSPIIVTFKGNGEDLVISAPTLNSQSDVEKFQKMPSISVKNLSGQVVEAKIDLLKQEGIFPNANIINDLSDYNASGAAAAVPALATQTMSAAVPMTNGAGKVTKGKITVQGENVAEQQLQYWSQQADKETQTRFLNWAKGQK